MLMQMEILLSLKQVVKLQPVINQQVNLLLPKQKTFLIFLLFIKYSH